MNIEIGVKPEQKNVPSLCGVMRAEDLDDRGYVLLVSSQESESSNVENVMVDLGFLLSQTPKPMKSAVK